MHERHVMDDLVAELERLSLAEEAPIVRIDVKLGALSHFTPQHFREHFADATRGTALARVEVDAEESDDLTDPGAQTVLLRSVLVAG